MEPFNLEQFKAGRKAVTRDGSVAEFLYYDERLGKPLGVIYLGNSVDYHREGFRFLGDTSGCDLTHMAPAEHGIDGTACLYTDGVKRTEVKRCSLPTCDVEFVRPVGGYVRAFCCPAHKDQFNNLNFYRGKLALLHRPEELEALLQGGQMKIRIDEDAC